jgi:hypothetical protein
MYCLSDFTRAEILRDKLTDLKRSHKAREVNTLVMNWLDLECHISKANISKLCLLKHDFIRTVAKMDNFHSKLM